MSLRKRVLLIIGATLIGLISLLHTLFVQILQGGLLELEEAEVREEIQRSVRALEHELAFLETQVSDWAPWDDTYQFIEDANRAYIESNLVDSTFANLELNFMAFVHSTGRIVFQKAFDLESGEEMPIPDGLKPHLTDGSPLLQPSSSDGAMDDYLPKPIRLEDLAQALQRVVPRPGPASAFDTAINHEALRRFQTMMGEDNPDALADLIDGFLSEAPRLLEQIHQALAARDMPALQRAAHTLKSTSALFGAETLSSLCKELEAMAHAGTLDGADHAIGRIEEELRRVRKALEQERDIGPEGMKSGASL